MIDKKKLWGGGEVVCSAVPLWFRQMSQLRTISLVSMQNFVTHMRKRKDEGNTRFCMDAIDIWVGEITPKSKTYTDK